MARTGASTTLDLGRLDAASSVVSEELPLTSLRVLGGIAAVAAAVLLTDLALPASVWAGFLAVSLILLGFWLARPKDIAILAGIASGLVVAGYLFGATGPWDRAISDPALLNRLIALMVIWGTAAALMALKRRQVALRAALAEAEAELLEVDEKLDQALRHLPGGADLAQRVADIDDIGHEVRTLLNAIIGFSDLASREIFGPHPDDRYGEYMAHINASGERLLTVFERHMAAITPGDHGVETGARRPGGGAEPSLPADEQKRCVNG